MTTRAGYWIGALLVVLAIVGAVTFGGLSLAGLADDVDAFERVSAPGQGTVRLDARKYVVYLEGADGDERSPPIDVTIGDARTGRPLPIDTYTASLTYALGGHAGAARGTVTPPRAGDYAIRARGGGGDPLAAVALGPSIAGKLARTIVGALAIGGVLGLTGLGLLVATAVRRSNAKARAARAAA